MIRKISLAVLGLVLALATADAQSNYASVNGSVVDPQHRPIPGARIHITASETGAQREVSSNDAGLFEIAGLQPGAYTLAVDSSGFSQAAQLVNLEVGQQATLNIQLSVGAEAQSVTVHASGELLKTQDSSVGEVVEKRSVESLPLNGRLLRYPGVRSLRPCLLVRSNESAADPLADDTTPIYS